MHSRIYEGVVLHRRREPVVHEFQYRLFMLYLDLDELPWLVGSRGVISGGRSAGCSFRRRDHLFSKEMSLDGEVREIVARRTGDRITGPIRLLTQLRHFGYYFSPLSLFYIFDPADRHVEYVLAEVNNTPWKERHCYVLPNPGGEREFGVTHPKSFHVSPFMGMDLQYRWRVGVPGRRLAVQLANYAGANQLFEAGIAMNQRVLSRAELRRTARRFPMMTARITAAIYYQALKLWWKKCPFYPHPKHEDNYQHVTLAVRMPSSPAAMAR